MDAIIFHFSHQALFSMEGATGIISFGQGGDGAAWAGWTALGRHSNSHFLAHRSFSVVSNSLLEDPHFVDSRCYISSRHQHEPSVEERSAVESLV